MAQGYPCGHASAAQGGYREKNSGRITAAASNPAAGPADRPTGSVVLKKLSPTSAGARRYAGRYGDTLVCVRYREDPVARRRLTTVELIVDVRPLPAIPGVRIAYGETELRQQVKAAGGIWDAQNKLWRLPTSVIRKLKLEQRVVAEHA
jgi:hypothetical protein